MNVAPVSLDDHAKLLGQLIGNLQSLEFVIRSYLENEAGTGTAITVDFETLAVGEKLRESPLTNYNSLGQLIDKYNSIVAAELQVEKDPIVSLRDGLAHGRVFSHSEVGPQRLFKFDRADAQSMVEVTHVITMSKQWFYGELSRVVSAIERVLRADERDHSRTRLTTDN